MNNSTRSVVLMIIVLGVSLVTPVRFGSIALGQSQVDQQVEFRIDTDIYTDESKPPVHTTQTMFLASRTIEWDDTNRRLLIVDYQDQSVTIADLAVQKKCRIEMQDLDDRLNKLRSQMSSDEIATWTSPVTARLNESGFYELACERSAYRFKTNSPSSERLAVQYADFADWSVKMHAVNPPYKPPLLRLQLNAFLRDQRELPTEVRLVDLRAANSRPIIARLLVQDQLTRMDMDRVRDWEVLTSTLKGVSEMEYFRQANLGPTNRAMRR